MREIETNESLRRAVLKFAATKYAAENVEFWLDVRRIKAADAATREPALRALQARFLDPASEQEINLSARARRELARGSRSDGSLELTDLTHFDQAMREVETQLMQNIWLPFVKLCRGSADGCADGSGTASPSSPSSPTVPAPAAVTAQRRASFNTRLSRNASDDMSSSEDVVLVDPDMRIARRHTVHSKAPADAACAKCGSVHGTDACAAVVAAATALPEAQSPTPLQPLRVDASSGAAEVVTTPSLRSRSSSALLNNNRGALRPRKSSTEPTSDPRGMLPCTCLQLPHSHEHRAQLRLSTARRHITVRVATSHVAIRVTPCHFTLHVASRHALEVTAGCLICVGRSRLSAAPGTEAAHVAAR